jgi:hypothetical protein
MKRWKYHTEINPGVLDLDRELDEYGSDGWELVCVVPVPIPGQSLGSVNMLWVFKKEESSPAA